MLFASSPVLGIKTHGNFLNILMVSLCSIILVQFGNSIFLSFQSLESLVLWIFKIGFLLLLLLLFDSSAAFLKYSCSLPWAKAMRVCCF